MALKACLRLAALAAGLFAASGAAAATFNIDLRLDRSVTRSQKTAFRAAESFWESAILGYQPGVSLTGLRINGAARYIDGTGHVLGQAGPTRAVRQAGFVLPTRGSMRFDSADLRYLERRGRLGEVILHEMAHVMGFGSLWGYNGLYQPGSGRYTGAAGLAAYRAEFDASARFVPVELSGGAGTRDSHWSEGWAGGRGDLMTGYLDWSTFVSDTTLAAFNDLGYRTAEWSAVAAAGSAFEGTLKAAGLSEPSPVPLPAPALLLLSGLGGVGLLGLARRRSAAA